MPMRNLTRFCNSSGYRKEMGNEPIMAMAHPEDSQSRIRVLLVDDLIATGGTAAASCKLVEQTKAHILGVAFVIELTELKGRQLLSKYRVHSLLPY